MAYTTSALVVSALSEARVLELADDLEANDIDNAAVQAVITEAIAYADGEIDDAAERAGYTTPLTSPPQKVKNVSRALAIGFLFGRRLSEVPGTHGTDYRAAIQWLIALREGEVSIPGGLARTEEGGVLPEVLTMDAGMSGLTRPLDNSDILPGFSTIPGFTDRVRKADG